MPAHKKPKSKYLNYLFVLAVAIIVLWILLFLPEINLKQPTGKPTSSGTESPTPNFWGCCQCRDRCFMLEDLESCSDDCGAGSLDYINGYDGRRCDQIPNCDTGCCFYWHLDPSTFFNDKPNTAGTCIQTTGTECLIQAGHFYSGADCQNVSECNDKYGCCISTTGAGSDVTISWTTMERGQCDEMEDSTFLEGRPCPQFACLKDDDCFNHGNPICMDVIGSDGFYTGKLGVHQQHCNTSIRSCEETVIEVCEDGCSNGECMGGSEPPPESSPPESSPPEST